MLSSSLLLYASFWACFLLNLAYGDIPLGKIFAVHRSCENKEGGRELRPIFADGKRLTAQLDRKWNNLIKSTRRLDTNRGVEQLHQVFGLTDPRLHRKPG